MKSLLRADQPAGQFRRHQSERRRHALFGAMTVVNIRMNWDKRYTTLAPVATIFGFAFVLKDPQNLLGKGEHIGDTLALVPRETKNIPGGDSIARWVRRSRTARIGAATLLFLPIILSAAQPMRAWAGTCSWIVCRSDAPSHCPPPPPVAATRNARHGTLMLYPSAIQPACSEDGRRAGKRWRESAV